MNAKLLSVEEARNRILAALAPVGTEDVTLFEAAGRVLAAPVVAARDQPPGDVSAMDGYAVLHADLESLPVELAVTQSIGAGSEPRTAVTRGTAARIFTGALMPEGADTVVVQEDTDTPSEGRVRINDAPAKGGHIRRAGSDYRAGEALLPAGRELGPRDLALAAAANAARVLVRRRPRVAILATGNELVPLGGSPARHRIIASTGIALAAALKLWGAQAVDLGIAPDDEAAMGKAVSDLQGTDVLLTLGGASVGEHDLVQKALSARGFAPGFWRIAMKPGKPLIFGKLGEVPVIGLPGNPVSSLVCALVFVRPALSALLGRRTPEGVPDVDLPSSLAECGAAIQTNGGRLDFMRGSLLERPGRLPLATPFSRQDSNQLSILSQSQCLIPRHPFAPASKEGEPIPIVPLRALF